MKAIYKSPQNCQACIDLGWIDDNMAYICAECNKDNTHTVEVLQLGVGVFGSKAIIKDVETGKLDTVSIGSLRIIEEGE